MQHQHDFYRRYYHRSSELGEAQRLIPAIVLIAVGALFLLSNLHIFFIRDWLQYWPAILVAVGVVKLVDSQDNGGRVAGGILVGVGGLLLARSLGYIEVGIRELWPLVLIGVGVLMLFQRTGEWHWQFPSGVSDSVTGNTLRETAVFGGGKRNVTATDFKGGKIDAVFGGFEIDLRRAAIEGDSASLELNAVFGGIEVRIPESWSVVAKGAGVFGGFVDSTTQPDPRIYPVVKRLVVRGAAVFGGVELKN
jgi:predicted membrane protein